MQNPHLSQILLSQKVVDEKGKEHSLQSNISKSEIEFLENIINNHEISRSLEIGCAMGISSLAICSSLEKKHMPYHHTIIDPFQSTAWNNIGMTTLKNSSIKSFSLIEKGSEIALPELVSKGKKFDFIFIDGWHTMDHTLLDIYYSLKLIEVGGIIVIDDVVTKPVNKAIRYFLNFPNISLVAGNTNDEISLKRKCFYYLSDFFSFFSYLIPFRKHLFNQDILNSDRKLKIGTSMIALKKVEEDKRTWNWYKTF